MRSKFQVIIYLVGAVALTLILIKFNFPGKEIAAMEDNKRIPTVGYFPDTFPRDPVQINNFNEHLLVGQIIEPLVENSANGDLLPSVAESWVVSKDAKTITFTIRKDLKFSNGKAVKAADVKFSLERQIQSGVSQSKGYLARIQSVNILSPDSVSIDLTEPYVAIFKALSRDHLGILPSGWSFDPNSEEPIIGTGPYRAIKKSGKWHLVANEFYRSPESIQIKEWELIILDMAKMNFNELPLPDLVPYATGPALVELDKRILEDRSQLLKKPVNHFMQHSGWWYPHGVHFHDKEKRQQIMGAIHAVLQKKRKSLGVKETTGAIPEGIAGYLSESAIPPKKDNYAKPIKAKVAYLNSKDFLTEAESKEVEAEYNVKFEFQSVPLTQIASLRDTKPDVLVFGYAGGFYDPEGFLVVVTSILGSDLPTIFGDQHKLYLKASSETDWSKRSNLYQELNKAMLRNHIIAPGWKPNVFMFHHTNIIPTGPGMSYTVKLINFQQAK